MPSYTLAAIKEARERVRQDMIDEFNVMHGTNYATANHLNGLEIEARLQTYLGFCFALEELEPVASEELEPQPSVVNSTSDDPKQGA